MPRFDLILVALALIGLCLVGGFAMHQALESAHQAGYEQARAEYAELAVRVQRQREEEAESLRYRAAQAERDADARKNDLDRFRADARTERQRLLDTIASADRGAASSPAGPSGSGDDAAVARQLLGKCSTEYERVAGEADSLAERLQSLQGWVALIIEENQRNGQEATEHPGR